MHIISEQTISNPILNQDIIYSGHITIKPESSGLSTARKQLLRVAYDIGLNKEETFDIILAVGEAISNAYIHGTSDLDSDFIRLSWHCADSMLTVNISDPGSSSAARHIPTLGCGIKLMRESMDEVHFNFDNGGNVTLRKRLDNREFSL